MPVKRLLNQKGASLQNCKYPKKAHFELKHRLEVFLVFIVIFLSCSANAQFGGVQLLSNDSSTLNLADKMLILESDASIEEVRAPGPDWKRISSNYISQGFKPDSFWLKIRLNNQSDSAYWYLTLDNTRLDYVDFYFYVKERETMVELGDKRRSPQHAGSSYPTFKINLDRGESGDLYIQVRSDTNKFFSPTLRNSKAFGRYENAREYAHWLYAILIAVSVLFQCLLSPAGLTRNNLYYGVSVFFGGMYLFCFYGEANYLLWPDSIFLKNTMVFMFCLLFMLFFILFIIDFLELRTISHPLYDANRWLASAIVFLLLLTLIIENNIARTGFLIASSLLMSTLALIAVYRKLGEGLNWMLGFAFSMFFCVIGFLVFGFQFVGLIPQNLFTANILLWLFPLDVMFITISFFARFNSAKREIDTLRRNIVRLSSELSPEPDIKLDPEGQARTPEGNNASARLANLNLDDVVQKLMECFDAQKPYLSEDITLAKVASDIDIRPDQLSAVISSKLNTSFSHFVNEYRIRAACKMMEDNPGLNLLELALESGFGSKTNFNRAFKLHMKMSPREYRKTIMGPAQATLN